MAKPVKAIYLQGASIGELKEVDADRNPSVVKWNADVSPRQNMMIWVQDENGQLSPKYQIPADGDQGFPLVMNKKNNPNGIYLNEGDVCRLEFKWTNEFTDTFTIPK